MFEKYQIDDLFYCTIEDMLPIGITNFGGAISIEGTYSGTYETILLFRDKILELASSLVIKGV